MSGLEVLAVVGLICQCWEPLKTTLELMRDIYEKTNEFKEDYDGVPSQFRELQTVLATLQLVLERVKQRSETERLEEASRASLADILLNCKSSMEDLEDLFKKHYLPEQDQPLARFRRAIHILAGKPELAKIQSQIDRYIQAITAHSSAFAPTAQEISNIITVDLERIIELRYGRLENLLKHHHQCSSPLDLKFDTLKLDCIPPKPVSPQYEAMENSSGILSVNLESVSEEHNSEISSSSVYSDEDNAPKLPISETSSVSIAPKPSISRDSRNALALDQANDLISQGSESIPKSSLSVSRISSANTKARRSFLDALATLNLVTEQDPLITLRKYRGLMHVSLCLTRVTKAEERDDHLSNAGMYNVEAEAAADRYSEVPEVSSKAARIARSQVTLDRASLHMRQARVTTKASSVKRHSTSTDSKSGTTLALEAFQIYEDLAAEYEDSCSSCGEHDIRAQAFLGCGEAVQMLQAVYGTRAVALLGYKEPQHYFDAATRCAIAGSRHSDIPEDVRNSIRRSFGRVMRLTASQA